MANLFSFEILTECSWSGARAGILKTPHGNIETPIFMPCGTNGTVKGLTFSQVNDCGAQIVLTNSYHLYLRPGHKFIEKVGGVHNFIGWSKPILTDSGGFQVFSLKSLRKITDDGVQFKDHRDGKQHFIGPRESMDIQNSIGADIIMAFDECVSNPATYSQAKEAAERTHRWLKQCIESHSRNKVQALFGIVQGSIYEDLRKHSAQIVTSYDLPGFAIGGVAVGEDRAKIESIVSFTTPLLPTQKPRYLMGIGTPWDIAHAIRCGIDMFDCVSPTRLARHGAVFTDTGRISMRTSKYTQDMSPIEANCSCSTCKTNTRAYLHHLMTIKETAGGTLLSIHNITYLLEQAKRARTAILKGKFREYFEEMEHLHNQTLSEKNESD